MPVETCLKGGFLLRVIESGQTRDHVVAKGLDFVDKHEFINYSTE